MHLKIKFFILNFLIYFFCNSEKKFFLEKLTFDSDVNFSNYEFLYLTKLKQNSFISDLEIKNAKKILKSKGRFEKIIIKTDNLNNGKHVHFSLKGNWIFKKIYIIGVLFGKHDYSAFYKMQSGDYFDIDLHRLAINKIIEYLKFKGYYDCIVKDELVYNKDKTISVYIKIKRNKKFFINNINFDLSPNICTENETILITNFFQTKIFKNLNKKVATKENITKSTRKFLNYLKFLGFVKPKIIIKKNIYKKNNFLDLIFNINLGKKQKLEFAGNKNFSEKYIRQNFLGTDYPSWFFTPEIIAQELFDNYYKKGYWDSVIFYKKQKDGSFLFNINENLPIIINNILVKDLENNLIKEADIFKELENKIFDENLLNQFINKLTNRFLKNGFWDFKILDKSFKKNTKENSCNIIITINKGEQRFLGNIKIIPDLNFLSKKFFDKYQKLSDQDLKPFDYYWLLEQKNFILKKMQKLGYWYALVEPILQEVLVDKKTKINLIWKINLGTQIKFGPTYLRGNSKVSFKKILKELKFKEGDIWDSFNMDLTRKNLKKLDLFKMVQIEPNEIALSRDTGFVPINLTLIDKEPIEAAFRFGYFLTNKNFLFKKASTYRVGTSLIFNNPTNNLDKFTLNVDLTRFERKFDFEYKMLSPFGINFDDSRVIGKLKVYSNKSINPVEVENSQSAYQSIENGILVGINNEFKRDYFWRFGIGNEWVRTEKVRGNINLDRHLINQTLPYFFINPSFVVEKINDHLDIKKGSINFASFRFMIPECEGKPIGKLTTEHSFFVPFYKDIIGALRIRLGYIFNSTFNTIQPSQRFFLGGPFTVRGYEKDAIPPYGVEEYVDEHGKIKKKYTIQGGSGMFNANLELRFPVYKLLHGVIFQDIGALSQTGFAGFRGKWYPSTGFGLRYKTPIGSIRFDLGFKWKHLLPDDTNYSWYLTLGEVF